MASDGLQQCKSGIAPSTNHALFFSGFLYPLLFCTLTCSRIYLHPLSNNCLIPISSFKKPSLFLLPLSGLRYRQFCQILCLFSLSAPHSFTNKFSPYWSALKLLLQWDDIIISPHVIIRVSKHYQRTLRHYQRIVTLSAAFPCRYQSSVVTLSAGLHVVIRLADLHVFIRLSSHHAKFPCHYQSFEILPADFMPLSENSHIISTVSMSLSEYRHIISRSPCRYQTIVTSCDVSMHYQSVVTLSEVSMLLSDYRNITKVSMSLPEYRYIISSFSTSLSWYRHIISRLQVFVRVSTCYQHNFHFHYHHSAMIFLYLHYHHFYSSQCTLHPSFSPTTCTSSSFLTSVCHSLVFPVISMFLFCHLFRTVVQGQLQRKIVNIGVGFPAIINGFHGNPSV